MEVGVNDDRVSLAMSSPLDSDGFLYRECPICEREFKWLHTPEGDRDWRDPFRPVASGSSNSRAQAGLDESRPRCTVISSASHFQFGSRAAAAPCFRWARAGSLAVVPEGRIGLQELVPSFAGEGVVGHAS